MNKTTNTRRKVSYKKYQLEILRPFKPGGKKYWTQVGLDNMDHNRVEKWLRADFDIWKELPNAEFRIKETIYWQPSTRIVKSGIRPSNPTPQPS